LKAAKRLSRRNAELANDPLLGIETRIADRREPGLTLFSIRPGVSADHLPLSVFRAQQYPEA